LKTGSTKATTNKQLEKKNINMIALLNFTFLPLQFGDSSHIYILINYLQNGTDANDHNTSHRFGEL